MQAAAPNIPNDRTVDLKKVYDAIVEGNTYLREFAGADVSKS
jgi:hypothetical protein